MNGTRLPSHVDQLKTPGIDMTAGSLAQGLSCALGIALACKIKRRNNQVFCIIGDGESQEGQIWEAAVFADHHWLDNLVVILDYNRMQIDGSLDDILSIEPLADKWRSFGWEVFEINGHAWDEIYKNLNQAITNKEKPVIIIANTTKGKGNICFEGQVACHYIGVPDKKEYSRVIEGVCFDSPPKLPYDSTRE
jgi:transketolase